MGKCAGMAFYYILSRKVLCIYAFFAIKPSRSIFLMITILVLYLGYLYEYVYV
jgi:hypothetical protein